MTRYNHKLNFTFFYYNNKFTIEEKGKLIAKEIRQLPLDKIDYYCGDDFEDLADSFENITACEDTTLVESFDENMTILYDMADRYGIWIDVK